jgi:3-methyladenine DNA glycosylase AlkD
MKTQTTPPEENTKEIKIRLQELASEEYAAVSRRFFKTGPGEYGEGDRFIGIRAPMLRKVAKEYRDTSLEDTESLLGSPIHEERFLALLLLMQHYKKGPGPMKQRVYELYLKNTRFINNWDLVDLSAEHIVGRRLLDRDKAPLYRLVRSRDLWERRIAIISTFCYIKRNQHDDTLKISEILLADKEDLIHKAVGWMLREVGKRDFGAEKTFLKQHYRVMPRTMLRYAIEKFPEELRQDFLKGRV